MTDINCDMGESFSIYSVGNDEEINILDVVTLVNFILGVNEADSIEFQVSDMNGDSNLNVQDIIILINTILN